MMSEAVEASQRRYKVIKQQNQAKLKQYKLSRLANQKRKALDEIKQEEGSSQSETDEAIQDLDLPKSIDDEKVECEEKRKAEQYCTRSPIINFTAAGQRGSLPTPFIKYFQDFYCQGGHLSKANLRLIINNIEVDSFAPNDVLRMKIKSMQKSQFSQFSSGSSSTAGSGVKALQSLQSWQHCPLSLFSFKFQKLLNESDLIYFVSDNQYDESIKGLRDLNLIYGRFSCQVNVVNTHQESLFRHVNSSDYTEIYLNEQITECMNVEADYATNIVNYQGEQVYFTESQVGIIFFRFPKRFTIQRQESCASRKPWGQYRTVIALSYTNQIFKNFLQNLTQQVKKQGLSAFYFGIMRNTQQLAFDFKTNILSNTTSYNSTQHLEKVKKQLNTQLSQMTDTLVLGILPSAIRLQQVFILSLVSYFEKQRTLITAVYFGYFAALLLVVVYFFAKTYRLIKKEMLESNRLLYIIDFESLREDERQKILTFLNNF